MRAPSIPIAATLSISLVLALQGCASTKEDIFPKDMRPMSEVYDRHFAKLRMRGIEGARVQLHGERRPPRSETSGATSPAAQVPPAAHGQAHPELAGYTREAHDEIEARFPVLPNPQLVLYVYPHLGEDGAPVPGYATAFPLYERVEYALAGGGPMNITACIYPIRHSGMDCQNPGPRDGDTKSCHKSHQPELLCSISRTFAARGHFFSCFSRKIALSMHS